MNDPGRSLLIDRAGWRPTFGQREALIIAVSSMSSTEIRLFHHLVCATKRLHCRPQSGVHCIAETWLSWGAPGPRSHMKGHRFPKSLCNSRC